MKKNIIAIVALVFMSITTMQAQVDRSKQPKPKQAPVINIESPKTFKLKNGMEVLYVQNNKFPTFSISMSIDNTPLAEGDKAGVTGLLSAMLGKGSINIDRNTFNEEVDYMGAGINISSGGAYASGLTRYFDRIVELMADAAINPKFTAEEFEKEKTLTLEGMKSSEKNVGAAAGRVQDFLAYGKGHPYAEFSTEETIKNINMDDVKNWYKTTYVPENAYLVISGDVTFKTAKKTIKKYFKNWKKAAAPKKEYTNKANVDQTQIAFVDMPNAVQSEIKVINMVDLKMTDDDYFAALIANQIFGGGFNSYLNQNLREAHGWTYGASSYIGAGRYARGMFNASTSVRNSVTDSAIVETLKEIKKIRTENVSAKDLKIIKAKYLGKFVMAMENPRTTANYALKIKTRNLPKDYYKTYLTKFNAVTIAEVKAAANKYIKPENLLIVIAGKGSEIANSIKNIEFEGKKIPVKFYDKYGQEVEEPVFSKPIPEGTTAQTVIEGHISAIGGKLNLEKVKSIYSKGNFSVSGQNMSFTTKKMQPNMELLEISHPQAGVVMKQCFDGASGYRAQMGQRMEMTEEEINISKAKKSIFDELDLDTSELKLESITTVANKDAYKISHIVNEVNTSRYYEVKTGLLIRTEATMKNGDKEMTTIVDYNNYKEYSGVKLPTEVTTKMGPQEMKMSFKEIIINENVSKADFK